MGVIRSRGFVPSFSPFVSDPKSEPSVIRSGCPVLVSTSHTVAARRRSYQYPASGLALHLTETTARSAYACSRNRHGPSDAASANISYAIGLLEWKVTPLQSVEARAEMERKVVQALKSAPH